MKATHRRKSSERVVTNEGPRMAIRDFNVFEMQRRNTAPTKGALAQKPSSVVTKKNGPRQDEGAKG